MKYIIYRGTFVLHLKMMICTSCLVVICGFTMTSFSPFSGTAVSTSAAVGITAVLIGTVALLV